MGSIISTIADKIKLHGSYEAYVAYRDKEEDIPYFPDPEEVVREEKINVGGVAKTYLFSVSDFMKQKNKFDTCTHYTDAINGIHLHALSIDKP